MIAFAYYLLKMFVCSGLLFAYYHLALKNKLFHQWNRFYLIASIIISLLVPCLEFNIWLDATDPGTDIRLLHVVYSADAYVAQVTSGRNNLSADQWITIGYSLISACVFVMFILALVKIYSIIRSHTVMAIDDIKFVNTEEKNAPFSFLNYVFWNRQIDLKSSAGEHIFEHELVHVRERHSIDKLFLQIVLIVFWCNPFFWLMRRELKMIHEFIADKKSVGQSDAHAFAKMILHAAYPQHYSELTSQFFNASIKRRLVMLTKNNNPKINYISRLLALPLMASLVLAFTLKQKTRAAEQSNIVKPVASDTVSLKPVAIRQFKDKSIQWIYNDSVGKKISWEAAQKMGFNINEKEFQNKMQQADKGYVESKLKFAVPKVLPDTLIDDNPLIVVDGMEVGKFRSMKNKLVISPEEIKAINVLKGESAIAKYGEKGKEGVIEITSKKAVSAEPLLEKIIAEKKKPLVIVDEKEYDTDLASLPADIIQSVTVLKDQSATSLYGPKASGGVIIITTKPGTSSKIREITVDGVKIRPAEMYFSESDKNAPIEIRGYGQARPKQQNSQVEVKEVVLEQIFTKLEKEAEFSGGKEAWLRYISKACNVTIPSEKGAPTGSYTVELQFVVHKDGSISNIKPLTKHGYGMEEEAIRVLKVGPKWNAGEQNGHKVDSQKKIVLTFVVADI